MKKNLQKLTDFLVTKVRSEDDTINADPDPKLIVPQPDPN